MALIKTFIDAFFSSFNIFNGLKTRHFYNIAQNLPTFFSFDFSFTNHTTR
jgi:hypothetical protein